PIGSKTRQEGLTRPADPPGESLEVPSNRNRKRDDHTNTEPGLQAFCTFMILLLAMSMMAAQKPIALHPRNPHYFLFLGKPTVLITSGEHYGAVLNGA